jgi:drug/metabolite transporter (DMT)-like permease
MVRMLAPFLLSALLFILVFIMAILESGETFLMLIFLGVAILLAVAGVYFVSQSKDKE